MGGGGCEDEVLGEEIFDFVGVGHSAHFVWDLTDGRVVDLWLDCQQLLVEQTAPRGWI